MEKLNPPILSFTLYIACVACEIGNLVNFVLLQYLELPASAKFVAPVADL